MQFKTINEIAYFPSTLNFSSEGLRELQEYEVGS